MEWRAITPCLEVSETGLVRSISRSVVSRGGKSRLVTGRVLAQGKTTSGYMKLVTKCHGVSNTFFVHTLVGKAFIPNPNSYKQINHKDGCKTNNHVSNLEWVTQSQNQRHAYDTGLQGLNTKFSEESQKVICALRVLIPMSTHVIGEHLGITGSTVQGYINKWRIDGETHSNKDNKISQ